MRQAQMEERSNFKREEDSGSSPAAAHILFQNYRKGLYSLSWDNRILLNARSVSIAHKTL